MERDYRLDNAKAIGIFLVVFAHVMSTSTITNYIYLFHMPLFFFISGKTMAIKEAEMPCIKFLIRKFKTICVPYFSFSLIFYIYWYIVERNIRDKINISTTKVLANIIIAQGNEELFVFNVVLWFLPCLFIAQLIVYLIIKKKYSNNTEIIFISILSISGYLLSKYSNIMLPWVLESALISTIFIYCGYKNELKKKNNDNIEFFNNNRLFLLCLSLSLLINHFFGSSNILARKYSSYFNFILAAFCGIYIVMYIANKFKNKYVQSVGMSSLIIMLVHEPIKRVIIKVMELLLNIEGEILRKSIVFSLLITLIIILVSIIIEKIIINYFPYIIGKNNKDKRYILSKFYKINNT